MWLLVTLLNERQLFTTCFAEQLRVWNSEALPGMPTWDRLFHVHEISSSPLVGGYGLFCACVTTRKAWDSVTGSAGSHRSQRKCTHHLLPFQSWQTNGDLRGQLRFEAKVSHNCTKCVEPRAENVDMSYSGYILFANYALCKSIPIIPKFMRA